MEKSCRSYFFQFDMIRTLNSVKTGEDTVGKVQMMIASNDFEMIRKLRKCLGVCADIIGGLCRRYSKGYFGYLCGGTAGYRTGGYGIFRRG